MGKVKRAFYISFKNQFPLLNRSTGNKLKIAYIRMSFFWQKKKNGIATHNYKKWMTIF